MIIFSRKTHGFVGETHHFRKHPNQPNGAVSQGDQMEIDGVGSFWEDPWKSLVATIFDQNAGSFWVLINPYEIQKWVKLGTSYHQPD